MFWNRKTALALPATTVQSHVATATENTAKSNIDLALKLITFGVVFSQAVLLIYGYSHLVGYYEQFGIDTEELSLGTPTLLMRGYINSFSLALYFARHLPLIGPVVLELGFVLIATLFIAVITKRRKLNTVMGIIVGTLMFIAFFAPAKGVQQGADNGVSALRELTQLNAPYGFKDLHTVYTDKNEPLRGQLIVVDSHSTFMLVGTTVVKLEGSTGRVIRETRMVPNLRKSTDR
ncbi:hypothetical protein ACW9H6_26975 [Pseudomonas sp. SDO528_S397]